MGFEDGRTRANWFVVAPIRVPVVNTRMPVVSIALSIEESDSATAWFYNFGQARILNRHHDGEKQRALSVRCVRY